MSKYLQGKNAIITGSSMGIGRAVACHLAASGVNVVLNSSGGRVQEEVRSQPLDQPSDTLLQALVADIEAAGGRAVYYLGSVANYECAEELVACCHDHFGSVDILVNCAGVKESGGSSILDMDPQDWQHVLGVHLSGTFNTCRVVAPLMKAQGRGSIINTGSLAWLGCYTGTAYPAGKGGTVSLSWAIANELKAYNIRCNVVCPGAKTRLSSGPDYESLIHSLCDRGLLDNNLREAALNPAAPEFVAPLYAYLGSDLSEGITGQVLSASGGYIGVFPLSEEEFLAYKDHDANGLWSIDELNAELRTKLEIEIN